jgi:hypothetical protein
MITAFLMLGCEPDRIHEVGQGLAMRPHGRGEIAAANDVGLD